MLCQKCNRRYVHERCFYCQPVAPTFIGSLWDSSAGNRWRVLEIVGDRVQVQHEPEGHTHWWHISSLTSAAGMTRVS